MAIFRQRYLTEETVALALASIVKNQSNGNTLDRILYFHSVRADLLLRDVVIELLVPHWSRGVMEIDVQEIESALRKWVEEGLQVHGGFHRTPRHPRRALNTP